MNPRRTATRTKKKLVMLTGTAQPREDLRRLVAWHSLEQPEHVLRVASSKRLQQASQAWAKKFPGIGRRIAKTPPPERLRAMQKIEQLGIRQVENALRKGFALKEVLNYPTRVELAAFIRRTTPERVKILSGFGLNEINAKNLCILFEWQSPENIRQFFSELRRTSIDPNTLSPKQYTQFYSTGKCDLLDFETPKDKRLRVLGHTSRSVIASTKPITRFVDFRRHGRALFSKNFAFSENLRQSLAEKGIAAFGFSAKVRKIVSSNPLVGFPDRHAFYLEVPEIADLLREARPKRQHLRNALAFADVTLIPTQKYIHIYELQSDIVGKLREPNREKYKSWAELTVLGLADFAAKNGYEFMDLSSPHIIKQVWPHLGRELTQRLYYDLPKKMGFELFKRKTAVQHYDSAFGEQQFGKSNIVWRVEINTLKKKFPEFFT